MLSYTTGTINEVDAATVGQTMAAQIRDDLIAHAAWELVEEFTAASGNVRWYVFKCLATESDLPADFFVVMGRTLSSGELRFAICEDYTAASHTMTYYAHNNVNTVTYDASGRAPTTFVLGVNAFSSTFGDPMHMDWLPNSASTKWWLIVADDGFTAAFNGSANGFVHLGAYTPLTQLPITQPINLIGSSSSRGGITRNPAVAGLLPTGYVYALEIEGGGGTTLVNGPILGFKGKFQYNDKLQNDQRPIAEQGMNVYAGGPADSPEKLGWALGKQKRMRVSDQMMPSGFAFGDSFELDGTLWVPYKPDDGRIWDTGVAA